MILYNPYVTHESIWNVSNTFQRVADLELRGWDEVVWSNHLDWIIREIQHSCSRHVNVWDLRDLPETLLAVHQDIRNTAQGKQNENNRNHAWCHLACLHTSAWEELVCLQRKALWIWGIKSVKSLIKWLPSSQFPNSFPNYFRFSTQTLWYIHHCLNWKHVNIG